MNLDLQAIFEQLKAVPLRTKLVAGASVLALVAVFVIAGKFAAEPHYVALYGELSEQDTAGVQTALAEAGIDFQVRGFPSPPVVWVDESRLIDANKAVALSGVLQHNPKGIQSGLGGMADTFKSSEERSQSAIKRLWEEVEAQLETLDSVRRAKVLTSIPQPRFSRNPPKQSASVTLTLSGSSMFTAADGRIAARLVTFGLGVDPNHVVISDQNGNSLFDPTGEGESEYDERSQFEREATIDQEIADRAMDQLEAAYGKDRILVNVHSRWDYSQTSMIGNTPTVSKSPVSTDSSERPSGERSVGGVPGVGANVLTEFSDGSGAGPGAAPPAVAKTEVERFAAGSTVTSTTERGPRLVRRSVALMVDQALRDSLSEVELQELEDWVKESVGFELSREDTFNMAFAPFAGAKPELDEDGNPIVSEDAPSEPNPMIEMLLERGVEIVSALAFLIVLAKSLRSKPKSQAGTVGPSPTAGAKVGGSGTASPLEGAALAATQDELDPDELAREQVQSLIRNDPERVGKILSRWTREENLVRS